MKIKGFAAAVIAAAYVSGTAHAASLGPYDIYALPTQVDTLSGSSYFYDGTSWLNDGTGAYDAVADSTALTDSLLGTHLTVTSGSKSLSIDFGNGVLANGAGADLVFAFIYPQGGNSLDISINGNSQVGRADFLELPGVTTSSLIYNGTDVAAEALNSGQYLPVYALEVDLADFGLSGNGNVLNGAIEVNFHQAGVNPMVLGMVGALNTSATVTPVPVPAAVWLFGSGLLGLVGVSRRRA